LLVELAKKRALHPVDLNEDVLLADSRAHCWQIDELASNAAARIELRAPWSFHTSAMPSPLGAVHPMEYNTVMVLPLVGGSVWVTLQPVGPVAEAALSPSAGSSKKKCPKTLLTGEPYGTYSKMPSAPVITPQDSAWNVTVVNGAIVSGGWTSLVQQPWSSRAALRRSGSWPVLVNVMETLMNGAALTGAEARLPASPRTTMNIMLNTNFGRRTSHHT
jgi:hypothetical protein